ncbi:hypothetical protein TNCT_133861, partial [Trichonephila clavata]
IIFILKRMSD